MRLRLPRALVALVMVCLVAAPVLLPTGSASDHDRYDQPVVDSVFRPVTLHWDVLIVPPLHGQVVNGNGLLNGDSVDELHPLTASYVAAVQDAVSDWKEAIDTLGADWIQGEISFSVYVLGRDTIPPDAVANPEVVFTYHEYTATVLGFAFRGFMLANKACWASSATFGLVPVSFTEVDMYNVAAHEFGHCLGLSHVEDNRADLMYPSYQQTIGDAGNARVCMSNLNVQGVEASFQHLVLGTEGPTDVSVRTSEYVQHDCS